ncbi:glycosyltransferase family 2 protein [Gammaproteobacteria bacterium]|nr:glycosyltransferase family 2 protein [Gammaproteobacteria bacterium]
MFPCFNEAYNLSRLVGNIVKAFAEASSDVEVILVDNGSTDDTAELLPQLIAPHQNIQTCRVSINRGYGFGVLSGLSMATGEILGWTHADMQTDPKDALEGFSLFSQTTYPEHLFVKGSRYGRPFLDQVFTYGMSIFESVLFRARMSEINAQPTLFHRKFYLTWKHPPNDFSLDLYVYVLAVKSGLAIKRFPVAFEDRLAGFGTNDQLNQKISNSRKLITESLMLRRQFNKEGCY